MQGVEKTNQMLDFIDDGLLGGLRGDADFADFEAEMKNIRQSAADPKDKQAAVGRMAVLKGKVANGIKATVVNGEVLTEDGEHTGAYPGQVLRGPLARR